MKTHFSITKSVPAVFFSVCLLLISCKKEKAIRLEGKLLISSSNPIPIKNFELNFYQSGSPSIPFPANVASAEASTVTDNNGNFKVDFKPGKAYFVFFQSTNSSPISVTGSMNSNFPEFFLRHFTSELGTYYLYKKIDEVYLSLSTTNEISFSDTILISYHSTNGSINKTKTGISIPSGSRNFVFDTIQDLALSRFDCLAKKYENDLYIRVKKIGINYTQSMMGSYNDTIGLGDELKKTLSFYF